MTRLVILCALMMMAAPALAQQSNSPPPPALDYSKPFKFDAPIIRKPPVEKYYLEDRPLPIEVYTAEELGAEDPNALGEFLKSLKEQSKVEQQNVDPSIVRNPKPMRYDPQQQPKLYREPERPLAAPPEPAPKNDGRQADEGGQLTNPMLRTPDRGSPMRQPKLYREPDRPLASPPEPAPKGE